MIPSKTSFRELLYANLAKPKHMLIISKNNQSQKQNLNTSKLFLAFITVIGVVENIQFFGAFV